MIDDHSRDCLRATHPINTVLVRKPKSRGISASPASLPELNAQRHSVRFVAAPELDINAGRKLRERLEAVRAPTVDGPVKLDLILKVWGIASGQ